MNAPKTSISLLATISRNADSVRWTEFFRKYERPMRDFLRARYPTVEADDAIQETLVALMKALPDYRYTPDVNGHFRNYLLGILAHKAADLQRKGARLSALRTGLRGEQGTGLQMKAAAATATAMRAPEAAPGDADWNASAFEAALEQLLADTRISPTKREVFRHVALLHEKPEDVAARFGLSRANVDTVKHRLVIRLTALIRAMTADVTTP